MQEQQAVNLMAALNTGYDSERGINPFPIGSAEADAWAVGREIARQVKMYESGRYFAGIGASVNMSNQYVGQDKREWMAGYLSKPQATTSKREAELIRKALSQLIGSRISIREVHSMRAAHDERAPV